MRNFDKKKPDEPCKNVLVFSETDEVSLFKNTNYKVSVSVGLNSSQLRPIVFVLDTAESLRHIKADDLNPSWLDSINHHNIQDIRSAFDIRLNESEL